MQQLFLKPALGVIVGMALAGCADFENKPLSPKQTAAEFEGRTLAAPGLKKFLETNLHHAIAAWPPVSLDFETLTLVAFYYHPSLDVARADWAAASAGVHTANEVPNPTAGVSLLHEPVPDAPAPWIPALMFDIPIETAGKRGLRTDQAKHLSESARLNIASAAWQVRSRVRSTLLDFVSGRQRVECLQHQVELQQNITRRFESQLQAGAVARMEVTNARIALTRARADLADAQRQSAATRVNVAEALGLPATALDGVSLTFDLARLEDSHRLTSSQARETALLRRPDILGALAEYAASQSALQLEVAKQYPDIHLTPGYSWNAGNTGDHDWLIGITSLVPMFNQHTGPIAEAAAHRDALAARFLALQARVIADIDRAMATLRACENNVTVLGQLAAERETRRRSMEAQFKAGAVDRLEVLNATLELAAARLAQLDAQAQAQQAFGALEDALQSPLPEPSLTETSTRSPTPSPKP